MAPRLIARHLSRPQGLFGRFVGFLMNKHNAKMNALAVKMLSLKPDDRVLEIGFGGGATLPSLTNKAKFVAGVDRSADVVSWAKAKYVRAIAAGRADFREGNVEALPFENASFGKVCTPYTSGNRWKLGLSKFGACSRRADASSSVFCRRNGCSG
jgi:arsenite methyltransferase